MRRGPQRLRLIGIPHPALNGADGVQSSSVGREQIEDIGRGLKGKNLAIGAHDLRGKQAEPTDICPNIPKRITGPQWFSSLGRHTARTGKKGSFSSFWEA